MSSPVESFLDAVRSPLDYLAVAPPGAAARTRLPVEALVERARQLSAGMPAALQSQFAALQQELRRLDGAPAAQRPAQVQRCRKLLDAIGAALRRPRSAYRRTTGGIDADLEFLAQSVQFVKGVGPRRAELLRKFGIARVEDLLYHLPFRYEDRRHISRIDQLRPGTEATVVGDLIHLAERFAGRSRRRLLEGAVRDSSGILALTWYNQVSYFRGRYELGAAYVVHGRIEVGPGRGLRIVHPEMDPVEAADARGIVPVYGKPGPLSVAAMRKLTRHAVRDLARRVPSVLPSPVAAAAELIDLGEALRRVHLPEPDEDIEALNQFRSGAHRAVVFDELFFLQLGMLLRRRAAAAEPGLALARSGKLGDRLRALLPFTLTAAQERTLREIYADMECPRPMHRLVQGDVGSGKTIVALFAVLVAVENDYQAAFMAPTELLAEQHYRTLASFAGLLGLTIRLLTSATPKAARKAILKELREGKVPLVVGTHALIQEGVQFGALGLGVIDEQHRFGVQQRAALRRLGTPDILLLTATPIPRTLALTVYADLDLSFIDEMPPGRKRVRTLVYPETRRRETYDLVRAELDKGYQGYVVYPLVEGAEDPTLRDATTMARELARTVFAGYRVGLVHGRMKGEEKEAVMRRFQSGDLQLLVSTTVVEVGIDVPRATIMVVEHAERFGLAQLHQLRGRVGRGEAPSVCVLVASRAGGAAARQRLGVMARSANGLEIAEADLAMRGPGDFLGTRQSGLPDFRVANLIRDSRILAEARRAAAAWLQHDPDLSTEESSFLRPVLQHRWAGRLELARTG